VKRVVLHPSAFADWFEDGGTPLRSEFEAGTLDVIVPNSFVVDALGVLANRGWSKNRLSRAGGELARIGFRVVVPPPSELAEWLVRGVPVSAASYAALASWLDVPIAVTDPELQRTLQTLPRATKRLAYIHIYAGAQSRITRRMTAP
jgi:hypothetical protein